MQDTMGFENSINRDIQFDDNNIVRELYGQNNENLKEIENLYGIRIHSRGGKLSLEGENDEVESAYKFLTKIYALMEKGYSLDPGDLELAARIVNDNNIQLEDIFLDTVCISTRKRIIAPKSLTQKLYIESIRKHDIVFGVGPAGTGKTPRIVSATPPEPSGHKFFEASVTSSTKRWQLCRILVLSTRNE